MGGENQAAWGSQEVEEKPGLPKRKGKVLQEKGKAAREMQSK